MTIFAAEAVAKGYQVGTHRVIPPAETVARLRRFMPVMGITRVANVTGLDTIGIPVVMVCRPNSRSLAVSQGKGLDLPSAQASGLMESMEGFHAEQITLPLKFASYEELRYTHRLVDPTQLPRPAHSLFHSRLQILWIEGVDLLQQEPVWVPYEMVHLNYTIAMRSAATCFVASSTGLAGGNHPLEAISHGLCEVVERDAFTLWSEMSLAAQDATRLDLAGIADPACRQVLAQYDAAGIAVAAWEMTSDIAIPAFVCQIIERSDDPLRLLYSNYGLGCHPQRSVALLRALTEAAQSRLTLIAGSRDDRFRSDYQKLRTPDSLLRGRDHILRAEGTRDFATGAGWQAATFDADVERELAALRATGTERVIVVDLTKPEFRLPVVRLIIPGLEPLPETVDYVGGPRLRAQQERHP